MTARHNLFRFLLPVVSVLVALALVELILILFFPVPYSLERNMYFEADPYLGAVGLLQFEVLKQRLLNEYKVRAELERQPFTVARWIGGEPSGLEWLQNRRDYLLVEDRDEHPVVLSPSPWPLDYALSQAKGLKLLDVSPLSEDDLK